MLIPLGILATTGAAAGPIPAYDLIETVNLAATATSITFSSILQDYKHLQIRYVAKTSTTRNRLCITINGVAGTAYANHQLNGNGSTVAVTNNISQARINIDNGIAAGTTNIFGGGVIDIVDYKSTTNNKTIRSLSGVIGADAGNQNRIQLTSGYVFTTTALTSLTFAPDVDSFAIGTRFSLYGIKG